MDIGGLTGGLSAMQQAKLQDASTAKLEKNLKSSYAGATDEELMDACKQFEAYFVEQMYKAMVKTIPKSEESSNYASSMMDYFKDEMIQDIAGKTTEQDNLGLAQMLYEQMKRNLS